MPAITLVDRGLSLMELADAGELSFHTASRRTPQRRRYQLFHSVGLAIARFHSVAIHNPADFELPASTDQLAARVTDLLSASRASHRTAAQVDRAVTRTIEEFGDLHLSGTETVLAHGDAWSPNLRFRSTAGAPEFGSLIDFEFTGPGPPLLDLVRLFTRGSTPARFRGADHAVMRRQDWLALLDGYATRRPVDLGTRQDRAAIHAFILIRTIRWHLSNGLPASEGALGRLSYALETLARCTHRVTDQMVA